MSPLSRRRLVSGLLASVAVAPALAETSSEDRRRFMARAFEMRAEAIRRGDQPFGAVVVKDGRVVGEGISAVLTRPDPTARGEIEAIRDAALRLGTRDLLGAELYSTFCPCPMCEAAAAWAGIQRMWYGAEINDGGVPRLGR
ncbi:MAG: nucleoside deaminase [Alphaproteobacteria bacterium]|nr:nucleoside deaminase [Alphaproteobacteria bacterium]